MTFAVVALSVALAVSVAALVWNAVASRRAYDRQWIALITGHAREREFLMRAAIAKDTKEFAALDHQARRADIDEARVTADAEAAVRYDAEMRREIAQMGLNPHDVPGVPEGMAG